MNKLLYLFLGGLFLSGCIVVQKEVVPVYPMFDQVRRWYSDTDFTTNGERIYFTARNERGQRIRYSGGQNFGGMMMGMGSNLSCASCHGSDGRGGRHTMHMTVMDAPDIRYSVLASEQDEHGGDHSHGDEHGAYDLDVFRLAVVGGVHPDGEPLSRDMPRWLISDQDLVDLFEHLKMLP